MAADTPPTRTASPPDPAPPPLLRQRNFLSLFGGQLISISGERLTYLAILGLLAENTAHFQGAARSSLLLWLQGNVMLLPVLFFAPFTGPWVDRWNLKRVMVISDALRAVLVALMPILYGATHAVGWVYLLVFLLFTCNVFFLPAKSAITPEIVPRSQLLLANALLAGAGVAGTAAGFVGSWIVDHLGWSPALYLNAVTYLVSVVSLLLIAYRPVPHGAPPPPVSLRAYTHEVAEGWRLVRGNIRMGIALTALGAVWVGGGFLHVAGNQHIARAAGMLAGSERVGGLMAVLAIGSAFGTWWVNTRGRSVPRHVLLGLGLVLSAAGLVAFAVSSRYAVFAGASLLVGLGAAPAFVLPETMLQEGTEPGQRGRIFSARDFLMRLVLLVGQSVAALAVPLVGITGTLLIAATLMAGVGALAFAMGHRADRDDAAASLAAR